MRRATTLLAGVVLLLFAYVLSPATLASELASLEGVPPTYDEGIVAEPDPSMPSDEGIVAEPDPSMPYDEGIVAPPESVAGVPAAPHHSP